MALEEKAARELVHAQVQVHLGGRVSPESVADYRPEYGLSQKTSQIMRYLTLLCG